MVVKIMPRDILHMNCSKSLICFDIVTLSTETNPKKLKKKSEVPSLIYIFRQKEDG